MENKNLNQVLVFLVDFKVCIGSPQFSGSFVLTSKLFIFLLGTRFLVLEIAGFQLGSSTECNVTLENTKQQEHTLLSKSFPFLQSDEVRLDIFCIFSFCSA